MLTAMVSGTPISVADAALTVALGLAVTFAGLCLLLGAITLMTKIGSALRKRQPAEAQAPAPADVPAQQPAPGSAGKVKLYTVPDREAAMIMAIVANQLGRPLNELRFRSIREVSEE